MTRKNAIKLEQENIKLTAEKILGKVKTDSWYKETCANFLRRNAHIINGGVLIDANGQR